MRFSRLLMSVLLVFFVLMGISSAAPTTSIPMPPRPTYTPPKPTPPPAPAPAPAKQRWRVSAKMKQPGSHDRFVYITWYGYPDKIDWGTAAVCEYLSYRFLSPWERMMSYYEIRGPVVPDMTTPIN